jgi:hypothetical protein
VKSEFSNGFAEVVVEGWLTITSPTFKDESKFPVFEHPDGLADILVSSDYTRINEEFKDKPLDAVDADKITDENAVPGRSYFYFRLSRQFLYYAESKTCLNVLGTIDWIHDVSKSSIHFVNPNCFNLITKVGNVWKYCGQTNEETKKFLCKMQEILAIDQDDYCLGVKPIPDAHDATAKNLPGQIVEKVITQPYILIPLAREMCNDKWDYANSGEDWKCKCKEGKYLYYKPT